MVSSPRASARSYRIAPRGFYGNLEAVLSVFPEGSDTEPFRNFLWQLIEWQRLSEDVVNNLMQGKNNANGTITLAASSATSTLTDRRIGGDTKVKLTPTTANAAAALSGLYQDLPNVTIGEAVLNHANNSQTDRTFTFMLIG